MIERPPTEMEEAEYDEFMDRAEGVAEERSAFSKLSNKLGKKKTKSGKKAIKDPDALAAVIGMKKYGKAGMAAKAAAGKAKAAHGK